MADDSPVRILPRHLLADRLTTEKNAGVQNFDGILQFSRMKEVIGPPRARWIQLQAVSKRSDERCDSISIWLAQAHATER